MQRKKKNIILMSCKEGKNSSGNAISLEKWLCPYLCDASTSSVPLYGSSNFWGWRCGSSNFALLWAFFAIQARFHSFAKSSTVFFDWNNDMRLITISIIMQDESYTYVPRDKIVFHHPDGWIDFTKDTKINAKFIILNSTGNRYKLRSVS